MFTRALWERSLADHARNIVSWITGIVALVIVQLLVYPTIRDSSAGWSNVTQDFPEVIKEILRMSDYTSETGYLNTELMSFTVPFIFIMMGATWGARAGTEDEEQGTADIVLSLPITRRSYLISRAIAALTVITMAAGAFVVTLIVGARLLDMSIPVSRFVAAGSALLMLGTLTTTVALTIGTLSGRRGISLGAATAIAIASFVIYSLAPLVEFFGDIEPTSLFRWTIGTQPLTEGVSVGYLLLSLGVATTLIAISIRIFDRRDITV